jgi:hypothetical protein
MNDIKINWKKCVCGAAYLSPQMWINGIEVCPHCKSHSQDKLISQEEAMKIILPWRTTNGQ